MNLLRYSLIIAGLALLAGAPNVARAEEDATPRFKKKGAVKDEVFFKEVGETIVKAARTNPVKFSLESLKVEPLKDKPHRRIVHLKVIWYGSATGTKFTSTIKLDCDATKEESWELLTIDYADDNIVPRLGSDARIKALVKKFNR